MSVSFPTPADFLTAFSAAAEHPICAPVVWPDVIPKEHKLRSIALYVRFWPVAVATFMEETISKKETGWYQKTFWYVIAATVCDASGHPAFTSCWPKLYESHILKLHSDYRVAETAWREAVMEGGNTDAVRKAAGPQPVCPQHPAYDENKNLVIPPPDFFTVGEHLKSLYDTPQGLTIMKPLWEASMDYNGWKTGESAGKNSETIASSVPSTEKRSDKGAQ